MSSTPSSLYQKIQQKEADQTPFFSLEFFPPRTKPGAYNLFAKFDKIQQTGEPLFIDITWGAGGGDPSSDEYTSSLSVASIAVDYCGLPTMLHLTCIGSTKQQIREILDKARKEGIRNILALRGDAPPGTTYDPATLELPYATDLVKFIREEYGDYFGICVAGYPNQHPNSPSAQQDLFYLKQKVDAGADFIITQLFFESSTFIEYVNQCREIGITCPILAGILPIQSYASIRHLMKLSQLCPPDEIITELERMKDDDEMIRAYGVQLATKMCQEIIESKVCFGFHFYTLNREVAVREILQNLNMWNPNGTAAKGLPWQTSANERRAKEAIRPIFWSTRPKSYLMRTNHWDEFPNGRWGDSSSPAFGNLSELYLFRSAGFNKAQKRKIWGETLSSVDDVATVFCNYILGKISRLPWSEDSTVAAETKKIEFQLIDLNRNGIFTTNSQPAVNGLPSTDPVHGWGEAGGYVYQKAYLEFFISPTAFSQLVEVLAEFPFISYHALNRAGESRTNEKEKSVNAVTWGVYPGKEIIQPTVVDPESFPIWKDEAFELWRTEWRDLYEAESMSYNIIENIYQNYYLVNMVDNDYVRGNIFAPFDKLGITNPTQGLVPNN